MVQNVAGDEKELAKMSGFHPFSLSKSVDILWRARERLIELLKGNGKISAASNLATPTAHSKSLAFKVLEAMKLADFIQNVGLHHKCERVRERAAWRYSTICHTLFSSPLVNVSHIDSAL